MGHDGDLPDTLTGPDSREQFRQAFGLEPETVHACVELDPHIERAVESLLLERLQLRIIMNDWRQSIALKFRKLGRVEKSGQQTDRLRQARLPYLHALLNAGDGKGIGITQHIGHPVKSMAVAVGLDHGHDLGRRRIVFDLLEVVS